MSDFKANDEVLVLSLKKEGKILEVLKGGEYRVAIGPLSMVCKAKNLKILAQDKWKKYQKDLKPKYSAPEVKHENKDEMGIDLHGMRLEEAMRAIERRMNEAILADVNKLKILHGVGMGILMTHIHKYLKGLSVVKHFELDKNNPGVTWVYF